MKFGNANIGKNIITTVSPRSLAMNPDDIVEGPNEFSGSNGGSWYKFWYTKWADGYEEVDQEIPSNAVAAKLPPIGIAVKLRRSLPPYITKGTEVEVLGYSDGHKVKFKVGNLVFFLDVSEFEKWEVAGEDFVVKDPDQQIDPYEPLIEKSNLDDVDPRYYGFSSIEEMKKVLGF